MQTSKGMLHNALRCDPHQATEVKWGPHCGLGSFSNRVRWSVIALMIIIIGWFMTIALTAPEESDYAGVLVTLVVQAGSVGGILLLSTLCCGEGPVSSKTGHVVAARRCGWGVNFDPRHRYNGVRYGLAAALMVPGVVLVIVAANSSFCLRSRHIGCGPNKEYSSCEDCDGSCAGFCAFLVTLASIPLTTGIVLLATMACFVDKLIQMQPAQELASGYEDAAETSRTDDSLHIAMVEAPPSSGIPQS